MASNESLCRLLVSFQCSRGCLQECKGFGPVVVDLLFDKFRVTCTIMQAEMFLNLLFKALKEDIDSKRMAAFAKRLTQVILFSSF